MRFALPLVLILIATPLLADEHDHEDLSETEGLRVLHGWKNASDARDMRVFMEIENNRDTAVFLTGAETEEGATGTIVWAAMKADGEPTPLTGIEIGAGRELRCRPIQSM
ncbi:hypothetical protein [Palleronia sp.]|uniref:hypothetical protein n=1 Tax=Palleronia sp. TaxID=1940284 RepID=UPI0035C7A5A9